jgi:hypothetical protein
MSLDSLKAAGQIVKRAIVEGSYRAKLDALLEEAEAEGEFEACLEAMKALLEDVRG